MSVAKAGHGALLAMELDPAISPGVFTTIAELNADLNFATSRPETNVTPHNLEIDYWVHGVMTREPISATVNFIHDNNTHDHQTGLQKMHFDNTRLGFRLRGPGGTADDHEIIFSGNVLNFGRVYPVREGVQSAEVQIRASGPFIVDGTEFGAAS